MKSTILKAISYSLSIFVIFGAVELVDANNKNKKKKKPSSKTGKPSELPTIESIGSDYITVRGKDYYVNDRTYVMVDGTEGELSDLLTEMQVSVSSRVKEYGRNGAPTTYWATRISARENKEMKFTKKEQAKKKKK